MTNEPSSIAARSGRSARISNQALAPLVSQQPNAALRGALLAFNKSAPVNKNHTIGTAQRSVPNRSISLELTRRNDTISTTALPYSNEEYLRQHQVITGSHDLQQYGHSSSQHGQSTSLLPSPRPQVRAKSPSYIAATLAASRTGPVSVANPDKAAANAAARIQRQSSTSSRSSRASAELEDRLDTSSIPSTNTLVSMFESNTNRAEKTDESHYKDTSLGAMNRRPTKSRPIIIHSPRPVRTRPTELRALEISPSRHVISDKRLSVSTTRRLDPTDLGLSSDGYSDARPDNVALNSARRPSAAKDEQDTIQPPRLDSAGSLSRSKVPPRSRSALNGFNEQDAQTIDQMANAIVASSLASSRVVSPRMSLDIERPAFPSRRGSKNIFHLHHTGDGPMHKFHLKSTPSPVKGMRQTMRKPRSDSEDETTKKRVKTRNPLNMKKHPNKHSEGDRKRWRDVITERERKRYEAVWASNKGLYMTPDLMQIHTPIAEHDVAEQRRLGSYNVFQEVQEEYKNVVLNIVVRDIWCRSRLPNDVLEEVWDLVDRNGKGYLEKEEFVVGLWLIDQRLKGRKLPVKVSDSVWDSIGLAGVKIKSRTIGKKKEKKRSH